MRLRTAAAAMIGLALLTALFLVMSMGPDPNAVPNPESVAARIMSPYCTGLVVADCPTRQSAELRSHIEDKVEMGWTNRQIDRWLVDNYGEQVLGRPRGNASWLVPLAAAMIGLIVVGSILMRRRSAPAGVVDEEVGPEEHDRVRADLDRYARGTTE